MKIQAILQEKNNELVCSIRSTDGGIAWFEPNEEYMYSVLNMDDVIELCVSIKKHNSSSYHQWAVRKVSK